MNYINIMGMYMSDFESKACKFLGVILFLILWILVLQLNGCTTCTNVPPPPSDYIDEVDTSHLV